MPAYSGSDSRSDDEGQAPSRRRQQQRPRRPHRRRRSSSTSSPTCSLSQEDGSQSPDYKMIMSEGPALLASQDPVVSIKVERVSDDCQDDDEEDEDEEDACERQQPLLTQGEPVVLMTLPSLPV